jgi:hypothetical protein
MNERNRLSSPAVILMWLFWCLFAASLVVYRVMLVGNADKAHSIAAPQSVSAYIVYVIPVVLAVAMRWLVIPKVRNPFLALIPFLFGLSVAEVLTFCGIFVFQQQFSLFFYTNWLLLLQMMPLWGCKRDETPVA